VSIISLLPAMRNRITATLTIAVGLLGLTLGAQQADTSQSDALARRAAARLTTLHAEADRLASQARTLLGELRKLEVERQIRREESRQIEAESTQATKELATLDVQIAAFEEQLRLEVPRLRSRLISLYKLGQGRYARMLLSTTDLKSLSQAMRLVSGLAAQDRSRVDLYEARQSEVKDARATLEARRQRLAVLRTTAAEATRAAGAAVEARSALIVEIDRRRDLTAQLAGELQIAQDKLQSTVGGLDLGSAAPVVLPLTPFRGDLPWPVRGSVRQAFGRAQAGAPASNGVDIAAPESTPVAVIHEGIVVFAGPFTGFGQLVIVDHGAQAFSLYGNLSETGVAVGIRVSRGDVIGSVGIDVTGAAGLYFELRIDARPVDPLQWLQNR
jgi:septal ring factor EnvC (AmiA/AmiB activator)